MQKVGAAVLGVLRFIGISLLIDLGLFVAVTLSCLIVGPCSNDIYSERMFWVGMVASVAAMPAVLAALSTNRGYYDSPFTAGMDAQVAHTIIEDGRLSLTKRSRYMWRMITIGAGGIGLAAAIDLLNLAIP